MDFTEARRRISDSTARLLTQRQFYGYLLQQMDVRHEPRLPAALGVRYDQEGGRIVLSVNPKWMVQPVSLPWTEGQTPTVPWTDANLVAVLEHECLHVVLKHLIRHPGGNRRLWNIAQDLVINQQLEGLPLGVVTLDYAREFWQADLPPNLHADGYYQLLQSKVPPCPVHGGGSCQPSTGTTDKRSQDHRHDEPQTPGNSGNDSRPPTGEPGHGEASGPTCPDCTGHTLDCHEGFSAGADRDAEEAMRNAVGYAYQRYKEQRGKNPGGQGRGDLPSDVVRMIELSLHKPANWRHLLRCIGDSAIKYGRRATIFRPNRRYGSLFPGRKPTKAGKVVVAVDTSGSVGDRLLGVFWAEILAMSRRVAVCVVECDAGVHDAWILRGRRSPRFKGGGGSDFSAVFDLVAGRGDFRPSWRRAVAGATSLVFLTDGDISVPAENKTGLDVHWAIPEGAKVPTMAYGRLVPLSVEESRPNPASQVIARSEELAVEAA